MSRSGKQLNSPVQDFASAIVRSHFLQSDRYIHCRTRFRERCLVALMTWSSKHSVGVEPLDNQHKALVRALNELHAASMRGEVRKVAGPLLRQIVSVASGHFSTEERLMESIRFPGLAGHRAKHQELTGRIAEFVTRRKGRHHRVHPIAVFHAGLANQAFANRGPRICRGAEFAARPIMSNVNCMGGPSRIY